MNIYIPLWLLWALPLGIYVIGVVVMFMIMVYLRAFDKAHGRDRSWISDIGWSFGWPFALFIFWMFTKIK